MFLSTYDSKVDGKNRVSIPASFRKNLGGDDAVFLWPSIDKSKKCLEGGSRQLIMNYQRAFQRLKPMDSRRRALEHSLLGRVREFQFDAGGGGRIVLSKDFKAHSGIEEDVRFVGLGDRFEVWSPARYDAMYADLMDLAADSTDLIDVFDEVVSATASAGEAA